MSDDRRKQFQRDTLVTDKLFLLESKVRTLEILFREQDDCKAHSLTTSLSSTSSKPKDDASFVGRDVGDNELPVSPLEDDLALDVGFILLISRGETTSVKYCMRYENGMIKLFRRRQKSQGLVGQLLPYMTIHDSTSQCYGEVC